MGVETKEAFQICQASKNMLSLDLVPVWREDCSVPILFKVAGPGSEDIVFPWSPQKCTLYLFPLKSIRK